MSSRSFSAEVPRGQGQTILVAVLDENNELVWSTRFVRASISVSHEYDDIEIPTWSGMIVSRHSRVTRTHMTIEGEAIAD